MVNVSTLLRKATTLVPILAREGKMPKKLNYRRKLMLHVATLLINAKFNFSANRAARRVMEKSVYKGHLVKGGRKGWLLDENYSGYSKTI